MEGIESQGRRIAETKPDPRRVRPAYCLKIGPASSSSHCRHSASSHSGGDRAGNMLSSEDRVCKRRTCGCGDYGHST